MRKERWLLKKGFGKLVSCQKNLSTEANCQQSTNNWRHSRQPLRMPRQIWRLRWRPPMHYQSRQYLNFPWKFEFSHSEVLNFDIIFHSDNITTRYILIHTKTNKYKFYRPWASGPITHSWDLFSNSFSPILHFIFSKFCLFCFLLDFFDACSKESIDGTSDWFDNSPYFWSSKNKQNFEKMNWRK